MSKLCWNFLLLVGFMAIVGCIDEKASAGTNEAGLEMPLKLELDLPIEGWYYSGQFRQEGDGPLGKLKLTAQANLAVEKAANWPAKASLYFKVLKASQLDPNGHWVQVGPNDLPEPVRLPPVQIDRLGRAQGTYNLGKAPLNLIGDLWPLSPKPIGKDEDYIEEIESKDQADPLLFKGTRKIIFHRTILLDGVPCAMLEVQTNLELNYANDTNAPPLKLRIVSHLSFDTMIRWPLFVQQHATYTGKLRQGRDLRDFNLETEWNLRRRGNLKAQPYVERNKNKEAMSEMAPPLIQSVVSGEAIKPLSIKVGGARLVRYYDKERGIRPFGRQKGYTLSLILELPEPNLIMVDGRIEKAVANTGQNILPERRCRIPFAKLSKDKKAVVFDVELSVPEKGAEGFAEISGALDSFKATGARKIDLGIMDFKAGAKSKIDGFSIKSVKKQTWDKENTRMWMSVNLMRASIKDVKFYRPDGGEIEVSQGGKWASEDRILSISFNTKGEFPPRGRIVFEVLDNITKHEIPFKLTNISLLGQPL